MNSFIIIEEPSNPIFIGKIVIEVSTEAVTGDKIVLMNLARTCDSGSCLTHFGWNLSTKWRLPMLGSLKGVRIETNGDLIVDVLFL